jgi:septal ring factor EnvC (AmiA/AmiB activator)
MTDTSNSSIYELADQFIALANQLSQQEADVGKVGTALRFAAARFNAFEASIKSADLGAEKESALEWFSAEYREMLSDNLDDHIANPPITQDTAAEEADSSVQIFKG